MSKMNFIISHYNKMPPKTAEQMAELRAMIGKSKKGSMKEKKEDSSSDGEDMVKKLKSEVRKLKKELKTTKK